MLLPRLKRKFRFRARLRDWLGHCLIEYFLSHPCLVVLDYLSLSRSTFLGFSTSPFKGISQRIDW